MNKAITREESINDWLRTLSPEQRLHLAKQYSNGDVAGYKRGTADSKSALRIKRIFIPALMVAMAIGAALPLAGLV